MRRGLTLLEILVASVLMLMLMGLVMAFIVPTWHFTAKGGARADMQQQVAIALTRLAEDVQETAPEGISLLSGDVQGSPAPCPPAPPPVAVGIDRIYDVTQSGGQRWAVGMVGLPHPDPGLIVYVWEAVGATLDRCVWMSNSQPALTHLWPSGPNRLSDTELLGIASSNLLYQRQTLATGVQLFTITSTGHGNLVASPMTFFLRLTRQADTGATTPEVYESGRTVPIRISG